MTGLFGGMACIFGGVPKRFLLLSDRLELTPRALTDFPELLSQQAKVFSLDATVFRRSIGHLSLPNCAEKPPDDDGLYVSPFVTNDDKSVGSHLFD